LKGFFFFWGGAKDVIYFITTVPVCKACAFWFQT
jgi:hypothetical protein